MMMHIEGDTDVDRVDAAAKYAAERAKHWSAHAKRSAESALKVRSVAADRAREASAWADVAAIAERAAVRAAVRVAELGAEAERAAQDAKDMAQIAGDAAHCAQTAEWAAAREARAANRND